MKTAALNIKHLPWLQEAATGESAAEAKEIKILGGISQDDGKKRVFISKLDSTLGSLANCELVRCRLL
jgi:hypothetical protein